MEKFCVTLIILNLAGSIAAAPQKIAAPPVTPPASPIATVIPPKTTKPRIGISIEGYGGFLLSASTSSSSGNSGSQTDGANAAIKYDLSNSQAFAGGAVIAYEIVSNLGVTLGFDYRSFSTRQYSGPIGSSSWASILRDFEYATNGANLATQLAAGAVTGSACTNQCQQAAYADFGKSSSALFRSDYSQKTTWKNMVLTLGIRPSLNLLGGRIYAGAGLALVLPYTTTTTVNFSNATGYLATLAPYKEGSQRDDWNLGIGGFGEFGYTYNITDNIFAGVGAKIIMASSDNSDKTRQISVTDGAANYKTLTITVAESVTEKEKNVTPSSLDARILTAKQGVSSNAITDVTAQIILGVRF